MDAVGFEVDIGVDTKSVRHAVIVIIQKGIAYVG